MPAKINKNASETKRCGDLLFWRPGSCDAPCRLRMPGGSRQIALAVHLPQELCVLDVDRPRFVQVLSNLLHNAAKFTAPEGRIDLTATMKDDESRARRELRLCVPDGLL